MRRFRVWAEVVLTEDIIEMPDNANDEECEEACSVAIETMISNGDSGFNEIEEEEDTQ